MQEHRADAHILQVELSGELGQQPRAVGHDGGMRLELERESVWKGSADRFGGRWPDGGGVCNRVASASNAGLRLRRRS
jgi:hypothetical protein